MEENTSVSEYINFNSVINNVNDVNNPIDINKNITDNDDVHINKLINDLKKCEKTTLQAEIDQKINLNSLHYLIDLDRKENLSICSFESNDIPEENKMIFKLLKPTTLLEQIQKKHNDKIKEIKKQKEEKLLKKIDECKTEEEKEKLKLKYLYNNILNKNSIDINKQKVKEIVKNQNKTSEELIKRVKITQKNLIDVANLMETYPELKNKIMNLNNTVSECIETAKNFHDNIKIIQNSLSSESWVETLTKDYIYNRPNERVINLLVRSKCPEAKEFLKKHKIFSTDNDNKKEDKIINEEIKNDIENVMVCDEEVIPDMKKIVEDNEKMEVEPEIYKEKDCQVVEFNEERMAQIEVEQREDMMKKYQEFKKTKQNIYKFNKKLDDENLLLEEYDSDLERKLKYKKKYSNKYNTDHLRAKEECPYCKKMLTKKSLLYDHKCSNKLKALKEDDRKICSVCFETFKKSYFLKHIKKCLGETNCIYCFKPVKKDMIERHIKHFNCQFTNTDKFTEKYREDKHIRLSVKESFLWKKILDADRKNIKCDFCKFKINKSQIARHLISCYNFKFYLINPAIFQKHLQILNNPVVFKDNRKKRKEYQEKVNNILNSNTDFVLIMKKINEIKREEMDKQEELMKKIPEIIENNKNNSDVDFNFKFKTDLFNIYKTLKDDNLDKVLTEKEKNLFKVTFKSQRYTVRDALRYNINKFYHKKLAIFPIENFKACIGKSRELELLDQELNKKYARVTVPLNMKDKYRDDIFISEKNLIHLTDEFQRIKKITNEINNEKIVEIINKIFPTDEDRNILMRHISKTLRVWELRLDIEIKLRENFDMKLILESKLDKKNFNDLIEEEFKNHIRTKLKEIETNLNIYNKYKNLLQSKYPKLSIAIFSTYEEDEESIERTFKKIRNVLIDKNIKYMQDISNGINSDYQNIIKCNEFNHLMTTKDSVDFLLKYKIKNLFKNNSQFNINKIKCFQNANNTNLKIIQDNIKSIFTERKLNFITDYIFDNDKVEKVYNDFEWPASPDHIQIAYKDYLNNINNKIYPPVIIRESFGKGYGLFAIEKIPANTLLFTYVGKLIFHSSVYNSKYNGFFTLNNSKKEDEILIDPRENSNWGYFVNGITRCTKTGKIKDRKEIKTKNIEARTERIITPTGKIQSMILYYTSKDVDIAEELLVDYGKQYWTGFSE